MSVIKLSQLETILNYALQFRIKTKSNKFCIKWRYDIVSHFYFKLLYLIFPQKDCLDYQHILMH
jgi:hypothetical protein